MLKQLNQYNFSYSYISPPLNELVLITTPKKLLTKHSLLYFFSNTSMYVLVQAFYQHSFYYSLLYQQLLISLYLNYTIFILLLQVPMLY